MKTKFIITFLVLTILSIDLPARYYNPNIGRFITADTETPGKFMDLQGLNRYSYCENNPVKYIDPTGHAPVASQYNPMNDYKNIAMRKMWLMILLRMGPQGLLNVNNNGLPVLEMIYEKHSGAGLSNFRHLAFGYLTAKSMGSKDAAKLHSIIPEAQYKTAKAGYSSHSLNIPANEINAVPFVDVGAKLHYDMGRFLYHYFPNDNYEHAANLGQELLLDNWGDFFGEKYFKANDNQRLSMLNINYFNDKSGMLDQQLLGPFAGRSDLQISYNNITTLFQVANYEGWNAEHVLNVISSTKDKSEDYNNWDRFRMDNMSFDDIRDLESCIDE